MAGASDEYRAFERVIGPAQRHDYINRTQWSMWMWALMTLVVAVVTDFGADYPQAAVAFFAAHLVVAFLKLYVSQGMRREPQEISTRAWRGYLALTVAAGGVWGISCAFITLKYGTTWTAFFTAICTGGFLAVGTAFIAFHRNLHVIWCLSTVMPPIVAIAIKGTHQGLSVGGVALGFTGVLLMEGYVLRRAYWAHVRSEQLLARASRAKDEFLAHMSHEIRTPLTSIVGMTDILFHTIQEPRQRERVGQIRRASNQLMRIINDLLDLSRIEAGKLAVESSPFRVRDVVRAAKETVTLRAAEAALDLDVTVGDEVPPMVEGDAGRLQQVLVILLENAVKFTVEGGIRLTVVCAEAADEHIMLRASVADTGVGIPSEHQARIFEPFEQMQGTLHRQQGGTGLGLSIASRLVRLMGGELILDSQPGRGSTFTFTIRVAPATATSPDEVAGNLDPGGPALRVLLAEDNPGVRGVVSAILTEYGHTVRAVENGRLAVDAVRAEPDHFDIVLMDLEMPVLDGLAATRAIRAESAAGAALPIVAVTAHVTPGYRKQCEEAGMDGFLSKPINFGRLSETIVELVAAGPGPRAVPAAPVV